MMNNPASPEDGGPWWWFEDGGPWWWSLFAPFGYNRVAYVFSFIKSSKLCGGWSMLAELCTYAMHNCTWPLSLCSVLNGC
jgi:hypothetical protein